MAETVEKISFELGAAGTDQLVAALAKVDQTLAKLGQESTRATGALQAVSAGTKQASAELVTTAQASAKATDEFKNTATAAARVGSTLNIVGMSAAKLSPDLGQLVSAAGRAGGAFTAMTTVLGGGIGGLAAGGLVAAFNLWSEASQQAEKDQEALAAAVAKTNEEIEKTNELARAAAYGTGVTEVQQIAAFKANIEKIKAGGISALTPQGQRDIDANERAIANLEAKMRQDAANNSLTDAASAQDKYLRLRASLGDKTAIDELANRQYGPDPFRGMPGRGLAPETELEREQHTLSGLRQQADTSSSGLGAAEKLQQAQLDAKKKANEEFLKENQRAFDADVYAYKQRDKEFEKIDKKTEQRWQTVRQVGAQAFAGVGTVGIQALNELAKGHKITTKQIVSGIGDQMVADGTHFLFSGAASALMGNPGGALVAEIGAAEILFGLALGAATRGSSPSGGKQSGPGFYGGRWSDTGPRSAIEPSARLSDDAGAGGNTYIVQQQSLIPDAQAGVKAHRAMREASRQGLL